VLESVIATGPGGWFPALEGSGIEPSVNLGMFEALLTGKTSEQRLADPKSYPLLASADDHQVVVIGLADDFVRALSAAQEADLRQLAQPWSRIEEFGDRSFSPYQASLAGGWRWITADCSSSVRCSW
jgi:hypothetical protein